MSAFNAGVLTKKGAALIAKAQAGRTTINYTRLATGSGGYGSGEDLASRTSLKNQKQSFGISTKQVVNSSTVLLKVVISNLGLTEGYYVKEIGLFATDPDEGEILYSIAIAETDKWDFLPAYNDLSPSTITLEYRSTTSNASQVTITGGTGALVSQEEFEEKIADIQSYIGYTENDILGVEVDFANKKFTRLAGAVGKSAGAPFDSYRAFGGRRRCILTDNGVVLAYYGEPGYSETGRLTQAITKGGTTYPVGTLVQVMIEQPRFYYKVVPLKLEKIEYKEINTIAITTGASAAGNITVNLDGKDYVIAVSAGDDITSVASKIRSLSYQGWSTGGTGANVIFTAITSGEKVTATINGGTTGVTATVTKTVSGKAGKGFHLRKARYYVSDTKKSGFKLHPGFIHNGKEKDYIYLSAYEGSLYDVSATAYIIDDAQVADFTVTTGDKLSSIAYAKPASGLTQDLTRAKTRILANNRGTGWNQAYAATVAVTQLLFTIEYASMNTQSSIGNGVMKTDDGVSNMSEHTGATSILGNSSGTATNGSISYRGEENFWMNINKWVDGLNIYAYGENSLYVADNNFADNVNTAPYKDAGITIARSTGYVSAFAYSEEFDWLFLASETLGNSVLPVGDQNYQNHATNGWCVARFGGRWADTINGGGFCWIVGNGASTRAQDIGGRLVYIPNVS